jgi:hypothetical protein
MHAYLSIELIGLCYYVLNKYIFPNNILNIVRFILKFKFFEICTHLGC